jgi:hypothetical protein
MWKKIPVITTSGNRFFLRDNLWVGDNVLVDARYQILEGALHLKGNEVIQMLTPTIDNGASFTLFFPYDIPDPKVWHPCCYEECKRINKYWFKKNEEYDSYEFKCSQSIPLDYETKPFYKIYSQFEITDYRKEKN